MKYKKTKKPMSKERRLDHNLSTVEHREHALKGTHIGLEILQNSIQRRRDSKTIVLIRKTK